MKETSFRLPHITLAGFTNGNVGKPPLLLLHGWLDNAGSFETMLPYLSRFHVIAVDLPGHGLSQHRSLDAHYHFVDWVYDVSQLIEHLHWDSLSIVGHSMGGSIATVVAAALPQKIKNIVLIDSIGLMTTPATQTCEQLRQGINSRVRLAGKDKPRHPTFESAMLARVLVGDLKEEQVSILLKRGLEVCNDGYRWRSDQRLRTHSVMRFTFEQATNLINNIQCPVLMIEGDKGAKMVKRNRELYQAHFADLHCNHMPGGHHCHMEYPETAAQLVNDFIAMR
ncbi:MAG: alpha/beta hydrolase [Algicola sp.]|nr:alpha/beta hydrolase [Algicola sp.]